MNKYEKWYNNLIERRLKTPYTGEFRENHHIIPRSFGGSNKKSNLVSLTPREHFICHLLLFKFSDGENKAKMAYALRLMIKAENGHQCRYSSKLYEHYVKITKPVISERLTGDKNPFYGKTHSEEAKHKMRVKRKNQSPPMQGKTHSNDTRTKLREANAKQFKDPEQVEMRRKLSKELWSNPEWRAKYKGNSGKTAYHNDSLEKTKMFSEGEPIPEGWVRGKKFYRK